MMAAIKKFAEDGFPDTIHVNTCWGYLRTQPMWQGLGEDQEFTAGPEAHRRRTRDEQDNDAEDSLKEVTLLAHKRPRGEETAKAAADNGVVQQTTMTNSAQLQAISDVKLAISMANINMTMQGTNLLSCLKGMDKTKSGERLAVYEAQLTRIQLLIKKQEAELQAQGSLLAQLQAKGYSGADATVSIRTQEDVAQSTPEDRGQSTPL
ncbi:hypothetical protein BCR37DRAFT_105436 [Protomyces lactucae-debilis]|uniref:No apical meristem-associated C-terminal domain-containing protein n=1 Tax=Protomyces lactucae-debilis TaxID=2754530 RepID=A0A1Y2F3P8_PROLT|nr:uncharacterized protein BCR37DRAFT_105436 [Protomyces lactucae-debilis]ORY78530.1 hypothetical protein BCR37DRAFT_105436 [Protomyces lactucae-debilis]